MRIEKRFRSIGAKIFAALFCVCALLFAYGIWSIYAISEAGDIVKDTYDRPLQSLNYARAANSTFHQMRVLHRDGKPLGELETLFHDDLDIAAQRVLSDDARRQVDTIRREFSSWLNYIRESNTGPRESALAAEIAAHFDLLTETMSLDSFRERQRAVDAIARSRKLAIGAVVASMVLAILMSIILTRQISRPLRIAAHAADKVSQGNFQATLPDGGADETGALLRSMRVMQLNIADMLAREEARARSAETRMADALETADAAVMLLDENHKIIYANSKVESCFPELAAALDPGACFNESLEDMEFILRNNGEVSEALLAGILDKDEIPLSNGSWVSVSRSESSDGGSVLIWTDISELKEREASLREAKEAAQAAAVAKSNFIANMSHEIRTPMNGVLGMAEILKLSNLTERQHELVSIILSSGANLMAVINAILDFSKLDAGKMTLCNEAFNLRRTVVEVGAMMQATAQQKGLELIVRYAPSVPEGVFGDVTRIRQILGNLAGNAVKFTQEGHVLINVDGKVDGECVELRIEVSDTGIGIAEADLPRMFQKFEQADDSKSRNYEGTGLGLAICKELIDLMGGAISATSTIGEGSCFRIDMTLPVDNSVERLPCVNHALFDGLRVLAIDDNRINRMLLEELLENWGVQADIVGSAREGEAALERASTENAPYRLILMDYQMPGESGDDFTGRIQRDKRYAATPVIMLSSVDTGPNASDHQKGRYAAWISKPLGASKLMDAIVKALNDAAAIELKNTALDLRSAGGDSTNTETSQDRPRVLIAEDNIVNQMVIKNLIDASRYDVAMAANGEIAVSMFEEKRPSLFITDLSMPVLDGFGAARAVRTLEREKGLPRTPIIAATAHVLDADRKAVTSADIDDFLAKPIRKDALDAMIEKWTAPRSHRRASASA
ncbi:response regulator [Hyphococcus sp.]|uniref:hybrid sensor histidine kinase/response regulator n=1 Tax=Hyphococcus sp. TaxID=2038636 RepID=UPI003CCB84AF